MDHRRLPLLEEGEISTRDFMESLSERIDEIITIYCARGEIIYKHKPYTSLGVFERMDTLRVVK